MQTRRAAVFSLALLLAAGSVGCAETSRTEVRTTTRSEDSDGVGRSERSVERTTVQADANDCDGVLSCSVDFVGDVIAFPFRLVGALFKGIF